MRNDYKDTLKQSLSRMFEKLEEDMHEMIDDLDTFNKTFKHINIEDISNIAKIQVSLKLIDEDGENLTGFHAFSSFSPEIRNQK